MYSNGAGFMIVAQLNSRLADTGDRTETTWFFSSGPSTSLAALAAAQSASAPNACPGFLAGILIGKTRHIGETAVFGLGRECADQFDAVPREKLGRNDLKEAAAHRVSLALGGFVNANLVDQLSLPLDATAVVSRDKSPPDQLSNIN